MLTDPTALLLARWQFAFTVSFHFLFPPFTIGLAAYLAVLEGLWLKTGKALYLDLFRYWLKIFAINFAMGVVSGIVLSYQFGTNWAVFSDKAGPIVGPLMAYEVLTAFFLEAVCDAIQIILHPSINLFQFSNSHNTNWDYSIKDRKSTEILNIIMISV